MPPAVDVRVRTLAGQRFDLHYLRWNTSSLAPPATYTEAVVGTVAPAQAGPGASVAAQVYVSRVVPTRLEARVDGGAWELIDQKEARGWVKLSGTFGAG